MLRRWRIHIQVQPDGREFADLREYKQLLLQNETAMPLALIKLLLSNGLRQSSVQSQSKADRSSDQLLPIAWLRQ